MYTASCLYYIGTKNRGGRVFKNKFYPRDRHFCHDNDAILVYFKKSEGEVH